MDAPADRGGTTPFLLRLFYRTGAFHRPDEFASHELPPSVILYAWPSSTLAELAHQLAAAGPSLLPDPSVGTRLAFRLAYPDTRAAPAAAHHHQPPPHVGSGPGRYVVRDLGSVVIGGAAAGAEAAPAPAEEEEAGRQDDDGARTLGDVKFVVGDYLSCAILPPLPGSGEVAPPSSARTGRGAGIGEAQPLAGRAPPPPPPPPPRREDGYLGGRAGPRAGRGGGGRAGGAGGGVADGGFGRPGRDAAGALHSGEWRRGERLPDVPSGGRGRGRPRW